MKNSSVGLIQSIMDSDIYDILSKEQLEHVPLVHIKKNTIFIPAIDVENIGLYYVMDGVVDVISQAYNGRSFLIDTVSKGEFIGKFSNMRKQNFYADIKTRTDCTLLNLMVIKQELLNNKDFLLFFYLKTSSRLYEMYKIEMMRTLFTYEEILAYCLLDLSDNEGVVHMKDKDICLKTSISERQFYYIMKKFKTCRIIEHDKKRIGVVEPEKLKNIAVNVLNFMKNRI